jgi:hypothetical protein
MASARRDPKPVRLRPREQRVLQDKLSDPSLSASARMHQRYRIVDEIRKGRGVVEAAGRVGCHVAAARTASDYPDCQGSVARRVLSTPASMNCSVSGKGCAT